MPYIDPPQSSLLLHRMRATPDSPSTASAAAATSSMLLGVGASYQKCPVTTPLLCPVAEAVSCQHTYAVGPNQCCSAVTQHVDAPASTVWSVVRRFDNPQVYKHFIKRCHIIVGDGEVGTLREVHVISGLPAVSSTERLEILDEENHVISFSVVGGDHRLANYRSVTTLHTASSGNGTVVVESYVVDIPPGNTKEETCVFVDTIVRCNLQSLAQIAEDLARNGDGR